MDNKSLQKSGENIEYTPIDEDQARLDYDQLRERLSFLRKKIISKQELLDITPKENEDLQRHCLEYLKVHKDELRKSENQFESVKRWFDKNNLPYPGSPTDQLNKEKSRKLREDYVSLIRKKVKKKFGKQRSKRTKKPKKKKTVHSERVIKRNKEIRSKYYKLTETVHLKSKRAMLEIAAEYELSHHTIRDIIYKAHE